MPKPLKLAIYTVLALLLPVAVVLGTLFGLISSESGTRLLAGQAGRWTGDLVHWQSLDGTLTGPLELRGLRLKQPGLDLELDSLTLDWQPLALLQGELRISRLQAEGGRLALSATEEPASSEPFDPGSLHSPLDLKLEQVRLSDLEILQADQPAQRIDALELRAALVGDELELQAFELRIPGGGLSLSGLTALRSQMPLQLQASWHWRLPGAANAQSPAGTLADVPLSGELGLDGTIDWSEAIGFDLGYRASATGVDGLVPDLPPTLWVTGLLQGAQQGDTLTLRQLTLELDDSTLALALTGTATELGASAPGLELNFQWQALQWPLVGTEPDVASSGGELSLTGTTAAYELALAADLGGTALPAGQWQLQGSGDLQRLQVHSLSGKVLGGELSASGPLSWDPMPSWQLKVSGKDLNPAAVLPDFPGKLAIELDSSGRIDPDAGLQASVDLHRLSGTLLDYVLSMEVRAQLAGETVALDFLTLDSDGNSVRASGTLAPEAITIDWELEAANPGALLPGAQGLARASGKLSGTQQAPHIQARVQGSNLRLDTLAVAALDATIEAGLAADDRLAIDATLGPVLSGDQTLLQAVSLRANGTGADHELALELDTASEHLQAVLAGGLDEGLARWTGMLRDFGLQTDSYGNWRLLEPAALALAAEAVSLGNSCLANDGSAARICLQADRDAMGDSHLSATLQDLPVALFVAEVSGDLAGEVQASLAASGGLVAQADLTMSAGEVRVPVAEGVEALPHGGGKVRVTVNQQGLAATLDFAAPEEGQLQAQLSLPRFNTLPPAELQPLGGRIQASLPRLDSLAAWVPELASAGGRLDADLRLAGTLAQPELIGDMWLAEGRADIPMAGLQLRQIELKATSNPEQPGVLDISGGLSSGKGQLRIAGQADMSAGAIKLDLNGERLQVYNTADARALLSPDLQISWDNDVLRLRGTLTIPQADITPQLQLSSAAATEDPDAVAAPGQVLAPSPDVVIVNAGEQEQDEELTPKAPFRIDSQVQVVLGKKVKINALGFASQLAGAVTFTNTPDQVELIPIASGRLDVQDGTFKAFGQDLEIETGQLIFAAVPATEPELNVRAVRWIDNDPKVTAAGVLVTGSATQPVVELFSRPQIETTEIQSYLLTGSSAGDQTSVLSIGTFLTPRFYVGYGYNLLESTNEFNSLFNITPRYGVGANVGEADTNVNVTVTYEH